MQYFEILNTENFAFLRLAYLGFSRILDKSTALIATLHTYFMFNNVRFWIFRTLLHVSICDMYVNHNFLRIIKGIHLKIGCLSKSLLIAG